MECLLIFIIVIVVVVFVVIVIVILLLLLSSMMILIIGFTCPPIIHFKFITLSAQLIITVCGGPLLQIATSFLLKVRQFDYKVRQVLQSPTITTRCYRTHHAKSKKRKQQLDDNRFAIMTPDSVINPPKVKFLP